MCELLVYANDDGDDDKLHPMRYRPGDVVVSMPDGHKWGSEELKPGASFRVIVFPDVEHKEKNLSLVLLTKNVPELDHNDQPITQKRRRYNKLHLQHPKLPEDFSEWWEKADGTKYVIKDIAITDLAVSHPRLLVTETTE